MSVRGAVSKPTERFAGVGLHTGLPSWFEVHPPRNVGRGIIFRSHLSGSEIVASLDNVISTNRSTCLSSNGTRVDTVEHLLSALYSTGVTDADVVFDGVELPIGDGSALPFVKLIDAVGIQPLNVPMRELSIDREVAVSDSSGAVITAVPSDEFWITVVADYSKYTGIGVLAASYLDDDYKDLVAPARTYGFHHELDALRAAGLGLGASYDNVIALSETGDPDPRTPLRMKDELVRHKILDLIGDLSLSQRKIKVGIVALKPSHSLNVRFSRELMGIGDESGVL